jgi:hypothetical protein
MQMHKKRGFRFFLFCAVLVMAGSLVGSYYYRQFFPEDSGLSPAAKVNSSLKVTQVDFSRLPEGLPKDLPLEKDAAITQNYQAEAGGRIQYTRQYASVKTPKENFELFKKYLEKNEWQILDSSGAEENIKSLAAAQAGMIMNLNFGRTAGSDQSFVDISVTQNK